VELRFSALVSTEPLAAMVKEKRDVSGETEVKTRGAKVS
jgi:hypothetical protein